MTILHHRSVAHGGVYNNKTKKRTVETGVICDHQNVNVNTPIPLGFICTDLKSQVKFLTIKRFQILFYRFSCSA